MSEKEDSFKEKVLFVNRCAKVLKGGRKFSFSALVLVGDGKGRVGYGFAKANELTDAIRKAGEDARGSMISFERNGTTIPHDIFIKHDGVRLLIKPAKEGTGVIAGSVMRSIFEFAEVADVMVKSLGCSNPLNLCHATFEALKKMRSRSETMKLRGKAA